MTKTRAPAALTITKATTQARRHVDKLMPGVLATVESRGSYDLEADVATMVTTVTFPHMHPAISELRAALHSLPGLRDIRTETARITITRTH